MRLTGLTAFIFEQKESIIDLSTIHNHKIEKDGEAAGFLLCYDAADGVVMLERQFSSFGHSA